MKSDLGLKTTLWIAFAIFLVLIFIRGQAEAGAIVSSIQTAITAAIVIRYVFVKWVWKWHPWLEKIHGVPILGGKWSGNFESTFFGNAQTNKLRDVDVVITQPNMFTIKITQDSDESHSRSFGEQIDVAVDGETTLSYSYINEPKATVRDGSGISYGTARYRLLKQSPAKLTGNYWTDRKTTGSVILTRR